MAWTFTEVFSAGAAGRETKSMVTHDGLIWAVTNEDHGVSGKPGRIYYSSEGDVWTEDVAWTGAGDVGLSATYEGQIFVHQGFLHLITCEIRGGNNNKGQLYRRQGGAWVLLHSETTQKVYSRAYSNDAWIVIGGQDFTTVNGGRGLAFISVWNGSTMTEEFRGAAAGFPYDYGAWDTIYYNGEWYAFVTRWPNGAAVYSLRYRGDGSWPLLRDYSGVGADDTHTLTVSLHGLFWGEDLWKNSGEWINTDFPGGMGRAGYQWGLMIGSRSGALYTYDATENDWNSQGIPALGSRTYAFANHEGQLYVGGNRDGGPDGPRIWRVTLYHTTMAGYWNRPTASSLVCDHEFGDTVYFSIYTSEGQPIMMKIDEDLEEWYQLYINPVFTAGSLLMQVQTALVRNVAYAYGLFGTDLQIVATSDAGGTFSDGDDDWGDDKITTMEYLFADGSDLTITNFEDKDLLRTLSGTAPWTKRGDIPGGPLSQVRDGNSIFVGCTAGSANLYLSEDIGQVYAVKGVGLPTDVDILDLELG